MDDLPPVPLADVVAGVEDGPLELAGHAVEGPLVGLAVVDVLDGYAVRPQQPLHLGLGEPPERLVHRDHPGMDDLPPVPLADVVAGVEDGPLSHAPVEIKQLLASTEMRFPSPLQAGHMPSGWLNEKRCDQPTCGRPQRENSILR